jgi:hypothetical protein
MQKNPFITDCRRGRRKKALFLSVVMDRKEKETSPLIEEFAAIVDEEIKKH